MTVRYLLDLESNAIHIIVFDKNVVGGVYRQAVYFGRVFCSGSEKQAKWHKRNPKTMYKYEPVTHAFLRRNPTFKLITHYSLWDFCQPV